MEAYEYITKIGHLALVTQFDGNHYHVFIDNNYHGKVVKFKGYWIGNLAYDSDLTIDEVKILGCIIEKKLFKAL